MSPPLPPLVSAFDRKKPTPKTQQLKKAAVARSVFEYLTSVVIKHMMHKIEVKRKPSRLIDMGLKPIFGF